jgi:hypothetical protein
VQPQSRLFLDSNILLPSWPDLPVHIENLLTDAATLKISVEIPYGVLIELRRRWRAETVGNLNKFRASLERIQDSTSLGRLPDISSLESAYDSLVTAILAKWSITTCPFPAIPIETLFRQANERQIVFQDKGINFQDAVIFHSAVERTKTGGVGVLLSGDGIFEERRRQCEEYAASQEANLTLAKLKEVQESYSASLEKAGLINPEMRNRYTKHKGLARAAVFSYLPTFTERVNRWEREQPIIPAFGGPKESDSIFTKVVDVDVPRFGADPKPNSIVKVSAIVQGTVVVTARYEGSAIAGDRTLRHVIEREVGFTAEAGYDGSAYRILRIHNITFGPPGHTNAVLHAPLESASAE